MKKILLLPVILIVLCGSFYFTNKNNQYSNKTLTPATEEKIYNIESSASYGFELDDAEEMYKGHEYIAIIHVDKIYPATTYREYTDEYIMPYTPGEATVLKALKGTFETDKISFTRLGGKVSYYEYEKSLYPSEREKFGSFFSEEDKEKLYINSKFKNDIDIENNKTYLVYMNRSDDFHQKNEYNIEAFEYGLREVNFENSNENLNLSTLKVKNNNTHEYEKIEKVVSKKITDKLNSQK